MTARTTSSSSVITTTPGAATGGDRYRAFGDHDDDNDEEGAYGFDEEEAGPDQPEETRALFSFGTRLYRCSETDGCCDITVVRHGNTAIKASVSYVSLCWP